MDILTACKQVGITDATYYRWRKEYGGMKVDQAKKYKELEQENTTVKEDCSRPILGYMRFSRRQPGETSKPGQETPGDRNIDGSFCRCITKTYMQIIRSIQVNTGLSMPYQG